MIYLASPYSHVEANVRQARYEAVCRAAALMMADGVPVFSPIAHSHPIEATGLFHGDHDWWLDLDLRVMLACQAVRVLAIAGWFESNGVQAEIRFARKAQLPITYWRFDEYGRLQEA